MSKPEAARYRTTNWKSYNEALRRRGSLLIWLDKDKDMVWLANKADRRGRPPVFIGQSNSNGVAYGLDDPASHSFRGPTRRNGSMFSPARATPMSIAPMASTCA